MMKFRSICCDFAALLPRNKLIACASNVNGVPFGRWWRQSRLSLALNIL
jgi:hypothetical protein